MKLSLLDLFVVVLVAALAIFVSVQGQQFVSVEGKSTDGLTGGAMAFEVIDYGWPNRVVRTNTVNDAIGYSNTHKDLASFSLWASTQELGPNWTTNWEMDFVGLLVNIIFWSFVGLGAIIATRIAKHRLLAAR